MKTDHSVALDQPITGHAVVAHSEWLAARKELLAKEKELTRLSDDLNAARRALPWEAVEKTYLFDSHRGKVALGELFGGKRQLIIYHFMYAPGWEEGCVGCSHMGDHIDSARQHFEQADVAFAAVSRGSLDELDAFKQRMGWTFDWVSSGDGDFNRDYKVSFTKEQMTAGEMDYNFGTIGVDYEELPGISVFYQDEEGNVFHTYSAYARGLDILLGSHHFLDLTPKGRCDGPDLTGWLKHHDQYENAAPKEGGCCGG